MKLFNVNDPDKPNDCIYIGRGTIYGNPFKIGIDGTRNEVIQKYIEYVENTPDLKFKILKTLKEKILCAIALLKNVMVIILFHFCHKM